MTLHPDIEGDAAGRQREPERPMPASENGEIDQPCGEDRQGGIEVLVKIGEIREDEIDQDARRRVG
jgi:hypothetical protein